MLKNSQQKQCYPCSQKISISNLLSRFISESLLTEKSRYEKETGNDSTIELQQYLKSLSSSDDEIATHAFTMIKIPKIGLNPNTSYDTPAGVYFYPLNITMLKRLINDSLPFVSDNPYFGIVKLNMSNKKKWLIIPKVMDDNQSDEEVVRVDHLLGEVGDSNGVEVSVKQYVQSHGKHTSLNTDAEIFDMTWAKANDFRGGGKTTSIWNKILRNLGYIGIYDAGNSVIHESEPEQLVCLSPEAYKTVGIWGTKSLRKITKNVDVENMSPRSLTNLLFLHKHIPEELLFKIAKHKESYFREQVAQRNPLPDALCKILATDTVMEIRREIAKKKNLSKEVCLLLSQDEDWEVKCQLARNSSCPSDIFLSLSKDEDEYVRHDVAKNISCPIEILVALSKDVSEEVRYSVARNLNCPKEILLALSKDSTSLMVSRAAKESIRTLYARSHPPDEPPDDE